MVKTGFCLAALALLAAAPASATAISFTGTVINGERYLIRNGATTSTDLAGQTITTSFEFFDNSSPPPGVTPINALYRLLPLNDNAVLNITSFAPDATGAMLTGKFVDGGHFYSDLLTVSVHFAGSNLFATPGDYHSFQVANVDLAGSTFTLSRERTYATGFDPLVTWETAGYDITGTLQSISATPAVPEPASWAVMIGGLGMIGTALRGRTRVRLRLSRSSAGS